PAAGLERASLRAGRARAGRATRAGGRRARVEEERVKGQSPGQRGVLSLEGVSAERVHREWQVPNTLWALTQSLVALLLFVLALPLMLVLYLPVRLSARAPFFFRQKRPGFMGRDFTIWKITTMRSGSDKVAKYEKGVTLDDPNVTRIGRFLRDTKID